MNRVFPFLALLVLPLAGCNPASTKISETESRLPSQLRNDAFAYYGLGNTKPVRLELIAAEGSEPGYGTRTVSLVKVEGGKATFLQHQDGSLAGEGDITLSLEESGLYVVSSTAGKLKPSLEIPGKLSVGDRWTDHTDMVQQGQKIQLENELKVERKERVATPGGTFDDALYVTSTGKGTLAGSPVTLITKHWYVRNVGPVKEVVEVRSESGPSRTITIQLAAPESGAPSSPATPQTPGTK